MSKSNKNFDDERLKMVRRDFTDERLKKIREDFKS